MRTYDISLTIHPEMPVWPGDLELNWIALAKLRTVPQPMSPNFR